MIDSLNLCDFSPVDLARVSTYLPCIGRVLKQLEHSHGWISVEGMFIYNPLYILNKNPTSWNI